MELTDAEDQSRILTINVEPAIKHAGGVFSILELREPRVSEVDRSEERLAGGVTALAVLEAEIALVALVSGWPVEAVEELTVGLLNQATAFVSSFEATEEQIKDLPDGASHVIELRAPVEVQKGSFAEMSLREPRVSERKRATSRLGSSPTTKSVRRAEIALVTEISGWPEAAVLKMPIGPFSLAAGFINRFLVAGRATGVSFRPT